MLSIFWIFVEHLYFPDLTQGKAVNNEEKLPVEDNDAPLGDEAKINGEMYVFVLFVVTNDNICHLRF